MRVTRKVCDLEHLHAGEEPLEVLADDVLERHEPLVAERHEPVEDRRHLDPGEVLLAGLGVADQHGEVEREPGDVGERVRRVDGQRGEHREDPLLEQPLAVLLLLAVEVVPADQLDAGVGQRGDDLVAEQPRVPLAQLARSRPRSARAPRAAAARTPRGRRRPAAIRRLRPATRTMKNSSRLLAKIARNRARSSSGSVSVLGELEHPLVEAQPGQLAVEEPVVELLDRRERRVVGSYGGSTSKVSSGTPSAGRAAASAISRDMRPVWHRR